MLSQNFRFSNSPTGYHDWQVLIPPPKIKASVNFASSSVHNRNNDSETISKNKQYHLSVFPPVLSVKKMFFYVFFLVKINYF